ncbi:MAG: carbohydrate kinase family protein, partial [Patescibacteria group bacterium]|nr:carbohydrate kinase family protein [Patescibacteria group bacterium]
LDQVVALKVNRREFQHVHKSIIDLFKNRILLLTKGSDGVELWHHGHRTNIRGHKISPTDTLGAGDTFFGSFVVKFLETNNAVRAAKFAVSKAEELLKKKGCGQ